MNLPGSVKHVSKSPTIESFVERISRRRREAPLPQNCIVSNKLFPRLGYYTKFILRSSYSSYALSTLLRAQ